MARVACAAVVDRDASRNLSFDLASLPEGEGTITSDAADVFAKLGGKSCKYQTPAPADPPSLPKLTQTASSYPAAKAVF